MKRILIICLCIMLCACGSQPVEKVVSSYEACRVTEYIMDLVLDDINHRLHGTVTMKILNETQDAIKELCLRNYAQAYLDEYEEINGISGQSIFESVYEGNQQLEIRIEEDSTIVMVDLKNDFLEPNEERTITVSFRTDLPSYGARFGYLEDSKGTLYQLSNCFPLLAMYRSGAWDKSPTVTLSGESNFNKITNFKVNLTLPSRYLVAASGNEEKTDTGYQIEAKDVREMAIVACDFMKINSDMTKHDVCVNHYYFDLDDNETFQEISLQSAVESMELFTDFVGRYPYEEIDIIEANLSGGMEFPGLVLIGSSYPSCGNQVYDEVVNFSQVCRVISHEIGHQWFYNSVGSHPYIDPWLDEGLTSFLETTYLRSGLPAVKKATELDIDRGMRTSKNGYTDQEYEAQIKIESDSITQKSFSIDNSFDGFVDQMGNQYSYMVYQGGNCFMWQLQEIMGIDNFKAMLQDYYATYYLKEASTHDFLNILRFHDNSKKVNKLIRSYIEK